MDIFETQKNVLEFEQYHSQFISLFQAEKEITTKKKLRQFALIYIIAYIVICLYLSVSSELHCIVIGSWLAIPAIILYILMRNATRKSEASREYNEKEIASTRKKHSKQIRDLESHMSTIQSKLRDSELPQKYHYSLAVNWMVEAIYSKRADTLKEVINAYEDYLQKERHNIAITDAISNIEVNNYFY